MAAKKPKLTWPGGTVQVRDKSRSVALPEWFTYSSGSGCAAFGKGSISRRGQCQTKLVFVSGRPQLALCDGKSTVDQLPVADASEAARVAAEICACFKKKKSYKACTPTTAQSKTLQGLGRAPVSCRRVGKLTAKKRAALPASAFALSSQRAYPIPDSKHAANAKARAKQMLKRKKLSRSDYDLIVRKADAVIARCSRSTKTSGKSYPLAGTLVSRRRGA
jgi:hypothetical protein